MKKFATKHLFIAIGLAVLITASSILYFGDAIPITEYNSLKEKIAEKLPGEAEREAEEAGKAEEDIDEMSRVEMNAARYDYFFRLMRDPATNQIPVNIRNRELEFAKTLPTARQVIQRAKTQNPTIQAIDYNWQQAGPFDVGGRTRALAIDQRDPNIILAGGVSGGMWKSTDGGSTWQLTSPDLSNLSVTSVAQDPTNPDTWYYASGEVIGNSASGNGAAYYGTGIYKSTDNGNSWTLMPQASSNTKGLVDVFNTVSKIVVSPTTGTVFIASVGFGIYRSGDGQSFSSDPVLGTEGEQLFCDVDVASDGTVAAVISEASFDDQQSQDPNHPNHTPGAFVSTGDGQSGSWTDITPSTFPDTHRRSVIAFAPGNPDIMYTLTLKGAGDTTNQGVSFHHFDLGSGTAEDRSANLPDFRSSGNGSGYVNMQGGYNMIVAVKPDDPNYVLIGGTNLFRSSDGFATAPGGGYDGSDDSQKNQFWIGGYNKNNGFSSYPNHHPDQHAIAFDPDNPDRMWSGNDGGLSVTDDVTANSVTWTDQDQGYVTSQYYSTAIPQQDGDMRLMGGTQDNGTPYFQFGQQTSQSTDISAGDGGYAFFSNNYLFVSSQEGRVIRWSESFNELAYVYPSQAENQIFIHPYAVDPNDENVMYYPEADHLWRNTTIDQIPSGNPSSGTTTGWREETGISVGSQYIISALEVSKNPGNILYLAGYSPNQPPVVKRLSDAKTATGSNLIDVSLSAGTDLSGAYIKDLVINPVNANEVIAVLSNYNIIGLYHTIDGGQNWEAIEGNLTGNSSNPGPSLRSAAIIPAESGTIFLVGTSTGLYSTQQLDGNNTVWGQEAGNEIGHSVTEYLSARISDGDIAAGTHGRGMFLGDFQGSTNAPFIVADPLKGRAGETITLRANDFQFNTNPSANEVTFKNTPATVISATASGLEVEIPRGILDRDASSGNVTITVQTGQQSIFTTFTILPPNNFEISQNYPNPFNPTTTIPFDIPDDSQVTLEIFNMSGQKVLTPLRQQEFNAGTYNHSIDLSGLASGVYIYRLIADPQSGGDTQMDNRKMTFIK